MVTSLRPTQAYYTVHLNEADELGPQWLVWRHEGGLAREFGQVPRLMQAVESATQEESVRQGRTLFPRTRHLPDAGHWRIDLLEAPTMLRAPHAASSTSTGARA